MYQLNSESVNQIFKKYRNHILTEAWRLKGSKSIHEVFSEFIEFRNGILKGSSTEDYAIEFKTESDLNKFLLEW